MFYNNKNLGFSIRYVYKSKRGTQTHFASGRKITALSFRLSGYSIFEFQNKRIKAAAGSLTYIPPGVDYTLHEGMEELIIIHLNAFGQNEDTIQIINTQDPVFYADLFNRIYAIWKSKCEGYENLCLSLLYRIFGELEKSESPHHSNHYNLIKDGIVWMRTHFQSPDITVAAIANSCGISEVYFRKLFKEDFGISPLKYIHQLRVRLAMTLLEAGHYSISEISEQTGFSDQRYFASCFKKETGMTPTEYKKNNKGDIRIIRENDDHLRST